MTSKLSILAFTALLGGPLALAQTSPTTSSPSATTPTASPESSDQSRGAKEQQSERKPCPPGDTTNVNCKDQTSHDSTRAHAQGADQSRGAKEQQSERKPCTGDTSNVNCKEKPDSSSNSDSSTSPKQ
jgi:hypothetical protein